MEKIFYLAQVFGCISNLAGIMCAISIAAVIGIGIWYCTDGMYYDEDKESKIIKKNLKRSVIALIISTIVAVFVPSKQTYLFMVGGQALEEIASNEKVQEKASKAVNLLEEYLENKVKESGQEQE